jgi:hypothetical protein
MNIVPTSLLNVFISVIFSCCSWDNKNEHGEKTTINIDSGFNNTTILQQQMVTDTTINYVPDEVTAVKIAEAIWLPIYGAKIFKNRPFNARLQKGVWIVEGTSYTEKGGVPYIEIQQKDCKILKVIHGK